MMLLLPGSKPTSGFQNSGKDSSWESQKQPGLIRTASHTPEIHVTSPILMVVIKRKLFVPGNQSRCGKDVLQWQHFSTIVKKWKEKTTGQKAGLPWEDPAVLHHLWSLRWLMQKHLSPSSHGGRWKTGRDPGLFVFHFSEWKNTGGGEEKEKKVEKMGVQRVNRAGHSWVLWVLAGARALPAEGQLIFLGEVGTWMSRCCRLQEQPNSRAGHVRSHTHSWAPNATVLLNLLKSLQSSSVSSCLVLNQRTWEAWKIEPGRVNLEVNKPSSYWFLTLSLVKGIKMCPFCAASPSPCVDGVLAAARDPTVDQSLEAADVLCYCNFSFIVSCWAQPCCPIACGNKQVKWDIKVRVNRTKNPNSWKYIRTSMFLLSHTLYSCPSSPYCCVGFL